MAGLLAPPDSLCPAEAYGDIAPKYRPLAERMACNWYEVPTRGNTFEILTSGMRKYDLLREDIRTARDRIRLEYYRFSDDSLCFVLREDLADRVREGVSVRLIYDNLINMGVPRRFYKEMRHAGLDVRPFTPASRPLRALGHINNRDHRKIAVFDGSVGYTGGMNLSEEGFSLWADTHLRMHGPVVTALEGLFEETWTATGGDPDPALTWVEADSSGTVLQLVASHPFPKKRHRYYPLMDSYVSALDSTDSYFYAKSPYFCPPRPVLKAVRDAAARGKDIRLILPLNSDVWFMNAANRSYFRRCIRSGVRIYLDTGIFDHSKVFVTDDYFSAIGTCNLDNRSLIINYEDNIYFYDRGTAAFLKEQFSRQMEHCTEVTYEDIRHWSAFRKMGNALIRIFVLDL
jgi:cardiolipin synthase